MNNLTVIEHETQLVVDSREVAEMVEKSHAHLLRDIGGYIEVISTNPILDSLDFFIPDLYRDAKGETRPCYLITRKGCDMVANKMTGEKGVIFTATYIDKFYEMEQKLSAGQQKPACVEDLIILQAQSMKELRQEVSEVKSQTIQVTHQISTIKEALIPMNGEWRKSINTQLNKIAKACDLDYQGVREESYRVLEKRAACLLNIRVKNLKARLSEGGATKTVINKACKLDAIEADKRLKEIYGSIVREMAVKYVA